MVAFPMGVLKMGMRTIRIWRRGFGFFRLLQIFMMVALALTPHSSVSRAQTAKPQITKPQITKPLVLIAFGDSLTAGYKLPPDASFPAQLEAALKARANNSDDVRVVNGGVSGDTAADGLARLDWTVPDDADGVIVELGANDALRGIPPDQTSKTLGAILAKFKQRRIPVLLTGMQAPRNWGLEYTQAFAAIFPALAQEHGVLLYPFFLDGVAFIPSLNQTDGLHPTREGVAIIVERIMPGVERLIDQAKAARAQRSQ
jgi:acyl-CoA thioesterase I